MSLLANGLKVLKKWFNWFIRFWKGIGAIIKSMGNWKGVTSLIITWLIISGSGVSIVGILIANAWLIGTGATIYGFWLLPLTPLIPINIAIAMLIQRFIFRDKNVSFKVIKALDNIYKLNDDGSSTKLAVSGATVAGDGLSFTHTSLSDGDFVWFDYYYQGTNVKGLSTVYYYGDKMIVADTTTGTVYKIIFTIDNGVITVDKVAV